MGACVTHREIVSPLPHPSFPTSPTPLGHCTAAPSLAQPRGTVDHFLRGQQRIGGTIGYSTTRDTAKSSTTLPIEVTAQCCPQTPHRARHQPAERSAAGAVCRRRPEIAIVKGWHGADVSPVQASAGSDAQPGNAARSVPCGIKWYSRSADRRSPGRTSGQMGTRRTWARSRHAFSSTAHSRRSKMQGYLASAHSSSDTKDALRR